MDNKKKIDKFEYISFDLFDTLITRNLFNNKEVFKFVEEFYNKNYTNKSKNEFYKKRILAERKARINSKTEEVTIEEIYKYIDYDNNTKEIFMQIEKDIEYKICEKRKVGYELYEYAIKKNKKVIIISDMYLDTTTIKNILKKNNIKYYKLFLSSEYKLTKSTSNLYKYVLNELKIKSKDMLHIGDNFKSDCLRAKQKGISFIYLPKPKVKNIKEFTVEENNSYNIMERFIKNTITSEEYFYSKGYSCLGPLLYAYAKWLEKNLKLKNYDNILFLSRDGYLMQKAFEIINSSIPTTYFYASRRALIVPTIHTYKNLEEILINNSFPRKMKISSFFGKIGIDKDNSVLRKCDYNLNEFVKAKELPEFISKIPQDLKEEIYNNSKKEYKSFIEYINKNKIKNNIAIIDIGWLGNMQKALCDIFKNDFKDKNVDGYYMGIRPISDKKDKYNMYCFLFEKGRESLYLKEAYFNVLFELVFLGHHGSVKKYTKNDVECYDYEYKNDPTKDYIYNFQKGALTFVKDFNESLISKYVKINENVAFYNISCLGNYPNKKDINELGKLSFFDEETLKLLESKSLIYYMFHIKQFKNDYYYCIWKPGFLRKVFKVKLNYLKIIDIIHKTYKKFKK